jgi:hypothetical protein
LKKDFHHLPLSLVSSEEEKIDQGSQFLCRELRAGIIAKTTIKIFSTPYWQEAE